MIAYLYAALTLQAGGRPVNRENLEAICGVIGLPVNEEWVQALASLTAAMGRRRESFDPEAPAAPSVDEKRRLWRTEEHTAGRVS